MNICLMYKEKNSHSVLRDYFARSAKYHVEEISLHEGNTLESLKKDSIDIIIFDVISRSEYDIDSTHLEKIKEIASGVPILLATGSNETSKYREKMLDFGVDGCVQLPFLQEELFLRIEKLSQKKNTLLFSGTKIDNEYVEMDIRDHTVKAKGERINLTKTEYSILFHLFLHKDTVVSNRDLFSCLDIHTKSNSHALNIHIFNVRKKIKDMNFIRTVPNYGFTIHSAS
ncbi:MAG: response regulator transcription factor, partial [Candidatus Pacebacteria bacterium]|nr:response regulator transcription factor [Candidatus Paceibacterota bacterium]